VTGLTATEVRSRLSHPIIDADGHATEFEPMFVDHLRDLAGPEMLERYRDYGDVISRFLGGSTDRRGNHAMTHEERRNMRIPRSGGWGVPQWNTLNRVTATVPGLFYDRMSELGIDYGVIYPSLGLTLLTIIDDELRQACCRAFNNFHAEIYGPYKDRLTPAAVIPMFTPEEAIAELEHAVNNLGAKVVVLASYIRRPIKAVADRYPGIGGAAYWVDTFGLDSEYDYDPVWKKCVELKVSPTFHSPNSGLVDRMSTSSYMYNQIGMFAAAGHNLTKSLVMGGVTKRFPELRCGMLEGGAAWGTMLFAEIIDRWHKRNYDAMQKLNPANLDRKEYERLFRLHGQKLLGNSRIDRLWEDRFTQIIPVPEEEIDEFARLDIKSDRDFYDLYVPHFFFGCEADDPISSLAFDTRRTPFGAKLNAIFGSDIGHWDVPDMTEVVPEAYEMLEHGLLSEEDFESFVFGNAVKLWGINNPDFFKGTAIEAEVAKYLAKAKVAA
jgi:predicted TIM-barrel fold metal-dependent hydrolase